MDAHDIDRGAPPQIHGNGRRRSSTQLWGAAPTAHGHGGRPTPHALAQRAGWVGPGLARGGGGLGGLTRASPLQGDPGPRLRRVSAPPPGPRQHAAAQRVGRPGVAALWAAPPTGGATSGRRGGQGPAIWWLPSSFVRPALPHLWAGPSNFGANVVYNAPPAQRLKKTIGAT
jgi:hypothetical protein